MNGQNARERGAQFLDKTIDDISDSDARERLNKLGIATPQLSVLLPTQ
jgi:hypothetical protein